MTRARRTRGDAGGDAIGFRQIVVVDAVDTERAFLHHADIGVELARAIGAGPAAELAADALVLVDQHDAVRGALVGGAGRADGDAGRCLAMQAGTREVHRAPDRFRRMFERVDAVEPDAVGFAAIGIDVGQRRHMATGVPLLAGGHAGLAADAGVEVDDEAELSFRRCGQASHSAGSTRNSAPKESFSAGGTKWGGCANRSNCGSVKPAASGAHFSMRTLRSNQAAWPVTGSELE